VATWSGFVYVALVIDVFSSLDYNSPVEIEDRYYRCGDGIAA